MPPYDGRVSGRAVCPLRRGVASSEAEMSYLLEGGPLPSSEAEMICPLVGRFATLERGGDEGRSSRVPMGALERSGDRPAGPEWGANGPHVGLLLSPFLSSRLEGGRGPLWAQSPIMCLCFLG